MQIRRCWPLLLAAGLSAQVTVSTYELSASVGLQVTTEAIVRGKGVRQFRHRLAPGSDGAAFQAIDRARNESLPFRIEGSTAVVELGRELNEEAEFRLVVKETVARESLLKASGSRLTFSDTMGPGRRRILLPPGFVVKQCSPPGQVRTEGGRLSIGLVHGAGEPVPLRVEMEPGTVVEQAAFKGSFRADDDRDITYYLEDPATHGIRLWLEMFVTTPGQKHFFSQLRKDDAIRDPMNLDMDRGVKLPTRILTGKDANALGEERSPDDAAVLVADLGYAIPKGGSARIRSYQTATDVKNYRLEGPDTLRLDRFLGRVHGVYVMPKGWAVTSVDQPAVVSSDAEGRTVLDFTLAGAESTKLAITARRQPPKD